MSSIWKRNAFLNRNGYLLVTAAWLITISFIIDNYWSGTATPSTVQKTIQLNIQERQKDFAVLYKDTALIKKLISGNYSEEELKQLVKKDYFFFIYQTKEFAEDEPVFWNTQVVKPDALSLNYNDGCGVAKLVNGWYVIDKKTFTLPGGSSYKLFALIPVKWDYYIENKYLHNYFAALKGIEKDYDITTEVGDNLVTGIDGHKLFYLHQIANHGLYYSNPFALFLKILAAFLVLLFIHVCATYYVYKKGLLYGFLVLYTCVIIVRVITYYLPIPFNFRQLELFDPAIYGSSPVLRSLGDLFINALLFVWIILFLRYHLQEKNFDIKLKKKWQEVAGILILSTGMILITILCGHVIRSLVADSKISFEVVNFFSLNRYSVVGFIILSCIATGYFSLFQILIYVLDFFSRGKKYFLYISISITGLAYLSFNLNHPLVLFDLVLLLWLLLFIFLLKYNYLALLASRLISSRFIFWIFFFSVSISAVIIFENRAKELEYRRLVIENFASKGDISSKTMMDILLKAFRNDFLADNFNRFSYQKENAHLKDSLIASEFSAYVNKYDTKIYTFNADRKILFNEDSTSYNTLNTIITTQAKPAGVADLFYYDITYDRFNYIIRKEVSDTAKNLLGYVYIIAKPKSYKSDALNPQLFDKASTNAVELSSAYAIAVYNKNMLADSYNDYPFPTRINDVKIPGNQFVAKRVKGYDQLWYKSTDNKIVVFVKKDTFFLESITLFAYLFCSFLLLTAIIQILSLLIRSRFRLSAIREIWQLSIRNQIHGTVIFISILSFLIIGITTILFFIERYHSNNREKLSRTIHVMDNDIRETLESFSISDDEVKVYDPVSNENLDKKINKIAEINSVDINLYNLNGDLKVSSLSLPYDQGIVSNKMDPVAYYHLTQLKDVQFFQDQKIGELQYLSNYVPVRDNAGREYAYLNIPYFESQSKLQDEISNFLVTIINLNAFIFLIGGIVALFITNRITRSFSFISNKMKEVNIGQENEPILWKRKDEIGELVNEYNKMVTKLDASAGKLARSEREGAWREMARQVAHEIKNPLTPMKLNLQYLQMAIDSNSPNVKDISVYVAKVLVEQIDHLSQIAGDFAQFANIGESKNQVFNLNESIKQVSSLYSTNESLSIHRKLYPHEIIINADKTQINRLLSNLLQNAIQSVPDEREARIEIVSSVENGKALVTIKDNGSGIPAEMHDKIFTPNFTTKTSGTGLGLAMCKRIVEKLNGNIWFDTKAGEYTIFSVELPVSENS